MQSNHIVESRGNLGQSILWMSDTGLGLPSDKWKKKTKTEWGTNWIAWLHLMQLYLFLVLHWKKSTGN